MHPTTVVSAGLLVLRLVVGAPGLMAPFVALTETGGGLLLIIGLATPLVGVALAGDMLIALVTAHIDEGFFAADGGIELVLLLAAASLALALTGAGRFSADAALRTRDSARNSHPRDRARTGAKVTT